MNKTEALAEISYLNDPLSGKTGRVAIQEKIGGVVTEIINGLEYTELNTTSKTVAGAINEIKEEIADEKLVKIYNTVAEMQSDSVNITVGMTIQLLGYYTKNDGAGHKRKIENTIKKGGISIGDLFANIYVSEEDITFEMFGAKGNGIYDDYTSIQTALEFQYENKINLYGTYGSKYSLSSTLLIPKSTLENFYILDGRGCTLHKPDAISQYALLESAYYNNGVLTSNIGTPLVSQSTFGFEIKNFIFSCGGNYVWSDYPAIRIQNYQQGTKLENLYSDYFNKFLYSNDSFYCKYNNLITFGKKVSNLPRFEFDNNVNLCSFKGLVAADSNIGYQFRGGVTATLFSECSFEGQDIGVNFLGEVYDVSIENCYSENMTDTVIKFNSYVENCVIKNNYFNFQGNENVYVVDYLPLIKNNIIIEKNNSYVGFVDFYKQLIKTRSSTASYNQLTLELKNSYLSNLKETLIDNSKISEWINIESTATNQGIRANLNNYLAKGNYSTKMTTGFNHSNGFIPVNLGTNTMNLDTAISYSDTQKIYINLKIITDFSTYYIVGEFIGNKFYKLTDTGYAYDSSITYNTSSSVFSGCIRIIKSSGTGISGNIASVLGEIRII